MGGRERKWGMEGMEGFEEESGKVCAVHSATGADQGCAQTCNVSSAIECHISLLWPRT